MDPRLDFFLNRVSLRFQRLRLGWLLTTVWSLAILGLILAIYFKPDLFKLSSQLAIWVCIAIVFCYGIAWLISRAAFLDRRWLANQIEQYHPSLNQRLITAVSSRNEDASRYLRKSLTEETLLHAYTHDWNQVVSKRSMTMVWFAQFVSLFFVIAIIISATSLSSAKDKRLLDLFLPSNDITDIKMEVQPGNAEIERGTHCLVTVRIQGKLPDQVSLFAKSAENLDGESIQLEMQRSLNDPVFARYLNKVTDDLEYAIEAHANRSETYRLRVFDYPALIRSDAELTSPAYAGQEKRFVKDTRRVTVPEGTRLTWFCHVNKPLDSVELINEQGEILEMTSSDSTGLTYEISAVVEATQKWKLRLRDSQGRLSKIEETLIATALPNKAPELKAEKITDATVSPLEELSVQAKIRDDYSLLRAGVQYSLANGETEERVLFDSVESKLQSTSSVQKSQPTVSRDASVQTILDFEAMGSEPDQLLSYFFWAEDLDRSGQVRRVEGEMYFAEVRPFDEIFRQGESPEGSPSSKEPKSPQAQKADELAELQKKIMSGTWNVIRSQSSPELSKKAQEDTSVLVDSQSEALELAADLDEKITDEQSRKYFDIAVKAMELAIEQLQKSGETLQLAHLKNALKSEQSAYEGLLRMREREHKIVQSKKPSSKSSSASQKNRQNQLQQMELKDEAERYEKENQASADENAVDREMRQIMSRLDELARRQEDINRQLKDLETAIQAAKNEEEKKELEEQLKRLRENEEELLRDTDELVDRMQSAEQSNQSSTKQAEAMEKAKQDIAQAREEIQKASEALSPSKPSAAQALSSGTRAEKQIEETRDQLREQSAQRFEETMKSMLSKARELEKQQEELSAKTLGESKADASGDKTDEQGGLRPGTAGEPKEEPSEEKAWQNQQKELGNLLQQMQDTVTEAEPSEPLLAEKLYETFRETKQRDIERRLDQVPQLVERGLAGPVEQTLDEIKTGMRELREGVEKAAESVLGSEVDSLRRALNELDQLEQQLKQEISSRSSQPDEQTPPEKTDASQANSSQPNKASESKSGEPTPSGKSKSDSKSGKGKSAPGKSKQSGNSNGAPSLSELMEQGSNPITGSRFGEWSDALRDVEESVRDPEMRGNAARIRQAARELHRDYQRHSKEPQWDLVREMVAKPLAQLKENVQAELLRKSADRNAVVPIDRDPVPTTFEQRLRRYYENLGSQTK